MSEKTKLAIVTIGKEKYVSLKDLIIFFLKNKCELVDGDLIKTLEAMKE